MAGLLTVYLSQDVIYTILSHLTSLSPAQGQSLSKDGRNWVSFGGHLRARTETYDNFAFGAPADADDSFFVYRALFHADLHFGEKLRVFSEIKHADISGRDLLGGARPIVQYLIVVV